MTEAVILVPGIMGSVLMDGDKEVWPGSLLELLLPYQHMKSLLKPDLIARDVIRSVSIVSQYSTLISALERAGFAELETTQTLKVFPYDWRKDNALAAEGLADCVDAMHASLGQGTEINLLAHSMGGLVSRYYLESGKFSTRPGFASIKRLITMGTPHRGSPIALAAAVGQEKRLFLNASQVQQIASNPAFPSLYQLMPPKGEPFAWDRAHSARYLPVDIYDPAIAATLGLEPSNLASAKDFHSKLDVDRRPSGIRYFSFVGTHQETTNSVQINLTAASNHVIKVDRNDAGDGTVPSWSATLPGIQMEPVGGEHGEIYKNGDLQNVLGALLGRSGVLLSAGLVPELSVAQKVVEPGMTTRVTIEFPKGTNKADGELQLRSVVGSKGTKLSNAPISATVPIAYLGAQIDHLTLLIDAPQFTGIYEIAYVEKGVPRAAATTELIVQGSLLRQA